MYNVCNVLPPIKEIDILMALNKQMENITNLIYVQIVSKCFTK